MLKRAALLVPLLLAACQEESSPPRKNRTPPVIAAPAPEPPPEESPDSQAPVGAEGGEGAAEVLRTYYRLIEAGRYDEAWKLRRKGPDAGSETAAAFRASFDRYAEYHANVGTPGPVSGAAGSLYVEIPVQIVGRMKSGEPFASAGTVTLRRVNNVPGSKTEDRRWRIHSNG